MKSQKTICIALILFSVLTHSCITKTKDELIVGKWQYVRMDLHELTNGQEMDMKDQFALSIYEGQLKSTTMQYYKDKTFESKMGDNALSKPLFGTYKLINDGKYIEETKTNPINEKTTTERSEIIELTSDTLKLRSEEGLTVVLCKIK